MKIIIKRDNYREIKFSVPYFGARIALLFIKDEGIEQYRPYLKVIIKKLKRYVKENGHFTLVEIESDDSNIKIIA